MLSCFSHVQFFATLWTVAHQTPLSMGFSRQEYLEWVAISFSRGSSQPRHRTQVSHIVASRHFNLCTTREALKTPPKKLLDLMNQFSKVSGYKIYIEKSVAFLYYTNNKLSEKEIIPYTVVSKTIKYLGINLTKKLRSVHGRLSVR